MKKAHGTLILERENEIITELRATRAYLEERMEDGFEVVNTRLDSIDKKMEDIETLLHKLLEK